MAGLTEVTQADKFRQLLQNAGSCPVVVHFWADWAPQCQQMTDVLVELAKDQKNKNIHFVQVEAEKVPEVSQAYEIAAVPTCVLLKNNTVVDRVNGAHVPELTSKVQKLAATSGDSMGPSASKSPPAETTKEDLNARLKKLVNAAPVMLFMKGTPQDIKCGFSKKMIGILTEQNVAYSSFNILADQEVRQGLKEFSNWPTYPQLYAKGELIGGIDIVTEMVESGEFSSMIPSKEKLEDQLKRLTNQEKVMLFMKGDPSGPRCGFSRTMVGILNDAGAKYGHFDILQDEEVRQGLKTYSNWPTYPQLYVNGELVGGIDIVKELKETGELESTLNG